MTNEFENLRSFGEFENSVKTGNHFLLDDDIVVFLKTIATTAKLRTKVVQANTDMFRSQKGYALDSHCQYDDETGEENHVCDFKIPLSEQRMRPRESLAVEGRVNTKGMPVFYCASDLKTSIKETRPWVNSFVSVARFNFSRDLKVVDCTKNFLSEKTGFRELYRYWNEANPSKKKKEERVWHDIDQAFSKPVTRNDEVWDYLSTQILAELFKKEEYDGIAYMSSVGDGFNLAVFDTKLPIFKDSRISKILSINITYDLEETLG